jgi:hypothetical protein
VDDAALLRIQTFVDGFCEIRMLGKHQNGFHHYRNEPDII